MPPFAMKSKEKIHPQTREATTLRSFIRSKTHRGKTIGSSPVQRSA
jgi:hypothetical protein